MCNPSLLLVFFLLTVISGYGQERIELYKGRKAPVAPIVEERDTVGINPFGVADKVELLYYVSNRIQWRDEDKKNKVDILQQGRLKLPEDSIVLRVTLDTAQIADWNAALYEMHLCEEYRVAGCYEPRHMLVFYDKYSKVLGTIEICVSCAGGWVSDGLRKVVFCPERTGVLASMISRTRENKLRK